MKSATFGLTLGACIAVMVGCSSSSNSKRSPLPNRDDIASIRVLKFPDPQADQRFLNFDLPEKHWDAVLAAFSPCKVDPRPTNWKVLCELEIQTKDRGECMVSLFDPGGDRLGAFAAGPDWVHRTNYRGGNSMRVRDVLLQSLEETKGTDQTPSKQEKPRKEKTR